MGRRQLHVTSTTTGSATTNLFANYNPTYTSTLSATYIQPLLRGFRIDSLRQQIAITQVNREIAEERCARPSPRPSPTSATPTGTWPTRAPPSTSRSARSTWPRSWSKTTRRGSRSARWRRSTSSRPRPRPPPAARPLAQAEATLATAQLALKRLIVTGTSDPLWTPGTARRRRARSSRRRRSTSRAPSAARSSGAPTSRQPRKNLDSNDITLRFWRNESLPALDLQVNYGAQGIGGTQFIRDGHRHRQPGHRHRSRRLQRCAAACSAARDFPTWNAALTFSYPIGGTNADAQYARTRVQRTQQTHPAAGAGAAGGRRGDQRRPSGAGQPAPRRCRPGGARPGRTAARGRAEQVRGRPVDQLLRGAGAARPGRRARTSSCGRSPTCSSRWSPSSARRNRRPRRRRRRQRTSARTPAHRHRRRTQAAAMVRRAAVAARTALVRRTAYAEQQCGTASASW